MVVLSSLPARNVYPPDPRRAVPFRSPKSYNSFPFQPLTNSFPQRRQPISFSHNSLHTLLPLTDSFFRRRFLPSSQPRPTERLTSLTPITCSLLALFLRPLSFLFSSLQPLFAKHPGGVPRKLLCGISDADFCGCTQSKIFSVFSVPAPAPT